MKGKISHEEAFSRYLALGNDRSFAALRKQMVADCGSAAVSNRSISIWSVKYHWKERAAEFDAKTGVRLVERTQTAMVQQAFNRVQSLQTTAQVCLDLANSMKIKSEDLSAQDVRALVATAIDAIKLSEVLTGGVSDRTEKVGGIAAEAMRLLGELEAEKRSHAKVLELTATNTRITDVDVP